MQRRPFIQTFIIFFCFFLGKTSKSFAIINLIKVGKKSHDFQLKGYNKNHPNNKDWNLEDFSREWLILYFYPKDFSNGCTLEAKGFQDNLSNFKKLHTSIVGISDDNEEKNESFCESEKLGYTLLSDRKGEISKLYDSMLEPYSKMNTFIIKPEVIVVNEWIGVRPLRHVQQVLEELSKKQKIYA